MWLKKECNVEKFHWTHDTFVKRYMEKISNAIHRLAQEKSLVGMTDQELARRFTKIVDRRLLKERFDMYFKNIRNVKDPFGEIPENVMGNL